MTGLNLARKASELPGAHHIVEYEGKELPFPGMVTSRRGQRLVVDNIALDPVLSAKLYIPGEAMPRGHAYRFAAAFETLDFEFRAYSQEVILPMGGLSSVDDMAFTLQRVFMQMARNIMEQHWQDTKASRWPKWLRRARKARK